MNAREAVAALDAIDVEDPEEAHSQADEIILSNVAVAVEQAYRRVIKRAEWWAYA